MSCLTLVKKDPQEIIWAVMDWSARLSGGATIVTSSWTVSAGITQVTDTIVAGNLKTAIKLSGGTASEDYACENTVTTSDGQTLQRTGPVAVRSL